MSLLELMGTPKVTPPWGSKGLVNRAGEAFRAKREMTPEELHAVEIISGDKAKTQTYCQIDELSDQVTQAVQKKDNKKVEELSRKIEELEERLGPEYLALVQELEEVDPNSLDGQEISSAIDALDRLCA